MYKRILFKTIELRPTLKIYGLVYELYFDVHNVNVFTIMSIKLFYAKILFIISWSETVLILKAKYSVQQGIKALDRNIKLLR